MIGLFTVTQRRTYFSRSVTTAIKQCGFHQSHTLFSTKINPRKPVSPIVKKPLPTRLLLIDTSYGGYER
jgi:hypothetical protein